MFKKILYPTDFSPYSDAVADCALKLVPTGTKEVILLHVVDKRLFAQFPDVSQEVINTLQKHAEECGDRLKTKLEAGGLKVDLRIEMGVPFNQIVGIAKAEAVSMIIMGSHGKSLVEEMLLGSTTENVLRHATVPLLIEKFETKKVSDEEVICTRPIENPFEKILFPTDFSDCSLSVIPYLKQLKGAGTKEIILLHVQDIDKLSPQLLNKLPEFEDIDTGRLDDIKQELEAAGINKITVLLKEGVPYAEIETVADNENVGMIAMGSHGRGMVSEMLLGSVSGKVVRKSKKPILIIRRK